MIVMTTMKRGEDGSVKELVRGFDPSIWGGLADVPAAENRDQVGRNVTET